MPITIDRTHSTPKAPAKRPLAARLSVALALVAACAALPATASADGDGRLGGCRELRLPVTTSPDATTTYRVAVTLCGRGRTVGRTAQVLISGAGHTRAYWDVPVDPRTQSYVRAATRAGYVTLNIDRLGSGDSDTPPIDEVTVDSDAYVLEQVISHLRTGKLARYRVGKIITVGFSVGSATAITHASRYRDVDGVIVTSFLHNFGPLAQRFGELIYPAADDPAFAGASLPAGYVTTRPGGRAGFFFDPVNTTPQLLAADEKLKGTFSPREGDGFAATIADRTLSQAIDVPVLVLVGQSDGIFCTDPACSASSNEPAAYGPNADIQVTVLPGLGHAINFHPGATTAFDSMLTWTAQRFRTPCTKESP
jgi:pimeloyl-ACP methyl ester carboxylesterase